MRLLAAVTAIALGAVGCQDLRVQRQPAASGPEAARLEARIVGLTEEVDRLSRRVAALEGRGGAPGPAAPARPGPAPAGEPPAAAPAEVPAAAPAAPTGIVIDARAAATEGEDRPTGTRHDRWRVLDFDGSTVFSSEDLPAALRRVLPVFWLAGPSDDVAPDVVRTVGGNPRTVGAAYAEVLRPAEGAAESLFYVDAAAANSIRSIPDLHRLIAAGGVAIILGR